MIAGSRWKSVWAGTACVIALGCVAPGVPSGELPKDPIAFRYRTPEEARRRAEDMTDEARRQGDTGPTPARRSRAGRNDLVASEDDLTSILARLFGAGGSESREYGGRLALLDPVTLEVTLVRAALRGSVPLAWSKDRTRLLFAQPGDGDFQIHEYDAREQTARRVTSGPLSHTQACYGPDGRIVVARVDPRKQPLVSYIAVSQPGGRGPFERISAGSSDHTPACAPDGSAVAFVREPQRDRAEIRLRTPILDGTERRLAPGRHPSFSPSGEWLVFAAPFKGDQRIARVRPDGSGRAPLGQGQRTEARPTVSPDGALVVYVASEERLRRHLYLRRFDGTGDRILFADGDGEFPVW